MSKEYEEIIIDYGSDSEIASQTIDGLRCKETVYVFTEGQLRAVKEKCTVPFYYFDANKNGYVLYPAKMNVVTEKGDIVYTDYFIQAKRYAKKQIGIQKLILEVADNDVEVLCFDGWNNYERQYIEE